MENHGGTRRGGWGQQAAAPGMQIQVDLSKAVQRVCPCGCKLFDQKIQLFTVSALLSPTGQELPVQVPVLVCTECKEILK